VQPALLAAAPIVSGLPGPAIPADYQPVPITEQEQDYSCGAAAALAVLRYWQAYGGDERSLYELLGTSPKDGTPPENIARGLSRFGLASELRENMTLEDLRAALRRGDSVILDIQAWRDDEDTPWSERWEDGHYVVLTGMDEHYAYVMDPSTPERYTYLPLPELLERWHDYEDRDGSVRRYYQTGIIARGFKPLPRPSDPPAEPEPIKMTRGPRSLSR
jgi:predicted double-glycine peptidase